MNLVPRRNRQIQNEGHNNNNKHQSQIRHAAGRENGCDFYDGYGTHEHGYDDCRDNKQRHTILSSYLRKRMMRWRLFTVPTKVVLGTVALSILLLLFVGIWDRCFYRTGVDIDGLGGSQPESSPFSSPSPSPLPLSYSSSFAVVINTYRRPERLKRAVRHYAEDCGRRYKVGQVFVVWADQSTEPPSNDFFWGKDRPPSPLRRAFNDNKNDTITTTTIDATTTIFNDNRVPVEVLQKAKDSLNARFEPIPQLESASVFMVDDDIKVACPSLLQAFSAWKQHPNTMVGFYPRLAAPAAQQKRHASNGNNVLAPQPLGQVQVQEQQLIYHLWPKVYSTQKFNIILTKASFLHYKYLELYTNDASFPKEIKDHVEKNKNCEDIAMSMLVANHTKHNYNGNSNNHDHHNHVERSSRPIIYVEGSVSDVGLFGGISSGKSHFGTRTDCLNQLTQIFHSRGWGSPLEEEFDLVENSWIQHSPGFWWQSAPSNPAEWMGLPNFLL
mmetsp:Transcript_27059/g.58364  ORF Transcript_27059/g.58364 Transcript_27059/m.58364 type:complete len:498 (+) Transcript_27059:55-1548(+)